MSRDEAYVLDMLRAVRAAISYADSVDKETFMKDRMRQLAVERLLEVAGEAAKRVSDDFRVAHPEVEWRRAAGLRDVITHEYNRIDMNIVWNILTRDLPKLRVNLEPLVVGEK